MTTVYKYSHPWKHNHRWSKIYHFLEAPQNCKGHHSLRLVYVQVISVGVMCLQSRSVGTLRQSYYDMGWEEMHWAHLYSKSTIPLLLRLNILGTWSILSLLQLYTIQSHLQGKLVVTSIMMKKRDTVKKIRGLDMWYNKQICMTDHLKITIHHLPSQLFNISVSLVKTKQ